MSRRLAVVVSCLATAAAGLSLATTATAAPGADAPGERSCVYTLSSPQVVSVSGSTMVHATIKPYPCTGSINPNYLSVCVKAQGGSTNGLCGFSSVPSFAEVFVPYKPGTTYVVSGTGCGSVYTAEGSICQTVGPVSTSL